MAAIYKSLYTCQPNEITYQDIDSFCSLGIPEGSRLEYKRELNWDITKTIAAMANADGGLILVGVSDGKDTQKSRSFPGGLIGIKAKPEPRQTIANWCYSNLQPAFCPEIIPVEMPQSPDKSIVALRIHRDKVPSVPVFHLDKKEILVRLDEQNRRADLEQMRLLFSIGNAYENKASKGFDGWLLYKTPTLEGFCWCTFGILVPTGMYSPRPLWTSNEVKQLEKAVEAHSVGNERPWVEKWHPLEKPHQDLRERHTRRQEGSISILPLN